ncbi:ABC transporter substrate-binding protein [Rhodococcus artemisiae]|uniref:ABC transporter substrate-binding protein n=1 Tax=Rhodococcus artemisiae TaxID=714159 RepID=A0ABU7L6F3_9NOCA|nr:ABC transporter substrate-binding protein [Rhodococcus artemisiae]MEE2056917.1 ABC transporter substrate-binding protein [Rhodococcus artemisiae]
MVAACIAALMLSACGAAAPGDGENRSVGEGSPPVQGGTANILQPAEPRSLDPAALSNSWSHHPVIGNALYGTLMTLDPETLEVGYKIATDFVGSDEGRTFTLTLRPDVVFSDGTPLDAAAVKFNWDRLRDPDLASTAIRQAAQVTGTEVIDDRTLKVTLPEPNANFVHGIVNTSMNWIASPSALSEGREAFDENPVGAGPFTLAEWTRQDTIELDKNPDYWDAPKPYLDGLSIRMPTDTNQRFNALTTGAADLSTEASGKILSMAGDAGLMTESVATGGGQFIALNLRRAPFDDERARRAVALAVDAEAIDSAVYEGTAQTRDFLFPESSPFHRDITFPARDAESAQKLFDELASEGKPVKFTFLSYPTPESRGLGESLQAQLSTFENVEVDVEIADYPAATARAGARDFDAMISTAVIQDPDYALWTAFHGDSPGNVTGIDDDALDAALDVGRTSTSMDVRSQAYATVQERLVALNPAVWTIRAAPSTIWRESIHGVELYAWGSPLPEELWLGK